MTNIITASEVLLLWNTTSAGKPYISDSTDLGTTYTLDMILDHPGDSCHKIMILNTSTLRASDVTEQFAAAWLKRFDEEQDVTLDDEGSFPAYVAQSRAWAVWKDDLEAERPIEDAETFTAIRRDHVAMFRPRPGFDAETGRVL